LISTLKTRASLAEGRVMRQFHDWCEQPHQYAEEWKKSNSGKVLGYFCTYMPDEILYAADILPVRIFGGHEADIGVADSHIHSMYCPYCRDCLSRGLKGVYNYLDGIGIAQSCLHMRQAFWSWKKEIPREFSYYLYMPHGNQCRGSSEYLVAELAKFKSAVEAWIGRSISDEDLDRGIETCNTNRRLMRQIWEYRKNPSPAITGLEAMQIVMSSQVVDKREHNEALKEFIAMLPNRKPERETGTRLAAIGSENDDRRFVAMVEQELTMPATFVIEEHCVGARYFWNEVIPAEDRLASIAKRYLDRPPCPSKDWPVRRRFEHLEELIRDWNVEGVLLIAQKFCSPQALDMPALTDYLQKKGLPVLRLEIDVTIPVGQFRTRVEAFLEMMSDLI